MKLRKRRDGKNLRVPRSSSPTPEFWVHGALTTFTDTSLGSHL